jgi:hypothetical protein
MLPELISNGLASLQQGQAAEGYGC